MGPHVWLFFGCGFAVSVSSRVWAPVWAQVWAPGFGPGFGPRPVGLWWSLAWIWQVLCDCFSVQLSAECFRLITESNNAAKSKCGREEGKQGSFFIGLIRRLAKTTCNRTKHEPGTNSYLRRSNSNRTVFCQEVIDLWKDEEALFVLWKYT